MAHNGSKQMRVSKVQYDALGKLSKSLGMSRVEVLNNAVALTKFLVTSEAVSVKAVKKDGTEKELFLTLLLANQDVDDINDIDNVDSSSIGAGMFELELDDG